jgi:hypothetical protein
MKDENITKTGSIRRAIKRGIYRSENGLASERVGIAGAVFQIPPLVATLHDMLHKNQQLEMPTDIIQVRELHWCQTHNSHTLDDATNPLQNCLLIQRGQFSTLPTLRVDDKLSLDSSVSRQSGGCNLRAEFQVSTTVF